MKAKDYLLDDFLQENQAKNNEFNLYLVLIDSGGGHESDNLTSVWSSLDLAEKEVERINKQEINKRYPSSVRAGVKTIQLDKAYDCIHDY